MSDFERLITVGFLFEETSIAGAGYFASYGDGYGEGVITGHPDGLREWKMKVGALPNVEGENLINAGAQGLQTRFSYLFKFYERHNVANWHKVFWFRAPDDRRDYLADIAEEKLSLRMLTSLLFSTGLTIRQRRVQGVESPSEPVLTENNDSI